jgi:hypothetical protein
MQGPTIAHLLHKITYFFIYTSVACAVGPSVNPLQNRETQHVNIILQCTYWFFEQSNMKGNHAWIKWYAFKCYHFLNWFFSFQNLVVWNLLEFSAAEITFKINISHILNPNLTK